MNAAIPLPIPVIPSPLAVFRGALRGVGAALMSFSDYVEKKILDHLTGKAAYTSPAPLYMALCTVAPTDADTGSTITEANYTGYARIQVPAADWNAAAGVSPAAATNAVQKQFAACTAGSSVVIAWALCDSLTLGNVINKGTCTSVTISPTQTPATVAAGALSNTLD